MAGVRMTSPPPTIEQRSLGDAIIAQPSTASYTEHTPITLDQPTQLVGSDAYTKWLMTRIATGVATPQEQAMWQQHVDMVKSKPRRFFTGYSPDTAAVPHPPTTPSGVAKPNTALQDYEMQLRLLERQNERRRAMAGIQSQPLNNHATLSPLTSEAERDYERQLDLLEQQNAQRMMLASSQQQQFNINSGPTVDQPLPISRSMDEQHSPYSYQLTHKPSHDASGHSASQQEHLRQLKLIEQQNKERTAYQSQMGRSKTETMTPTAPVADVSTMRAPKDIMAHGRKSEPRASSPSGMNARGSIRKTAEKYAEPFCKFLTENPTVFHAVNAVKEQLKEAGFKQLSERDEWDLKTGGDYFVERNGSALIAFSVGDEYKAGNGAAILAGHVDALTVKLKPISQVPNKAGYVQLGVAPYAGAPNTTWWDRDLSVGGRVLVKEGDKIVTKLVKLDWPIARIPTLAPHFGAAANGPFNPETQMVPIIGLEDTTSHASPYQTAEPFANPSVLGGGVDNFVTTQPPRLVKAIGNALGLRVDTYANIVNWELELYDHQAATLGGLDKEFIYAGRIDDKLCSWAAIQALIESRSSSGQLRMVGLFDDEEIGSLLRQGAHGNFMPTVLERTVGSLAGHSPGSDLMGRTYANSFLVSSDVTHAVNPNFLGAYLENHAPHLNVGVVVSADSNGHMTTDAVSTAILKRCADKVGAQLQVFQIRNDSRSGGTVGPMLSSAMGMRSVDAGIPQLSMHSIRATTGALDPGLGVMCFKGFLEGFEAVDREFRE
ncbi:hypothetical protein LTR62_001699 [Meristemomyces frigidus]|uniref:Aspartyl aminopeptidase n=1 Tax=Meristemomyces frigidus TaxID=1508187 RepID=A0AAN7YKX6_9PEZI|nr:hypothetical protein LTR62_001699 [Meristemomyces frigidus]